MSPVAHIVFVIGSMQVGGAERHISLIAPRLSQLGYRVTVYCIFGGGPLEAAYKDTDVEIVILGQQFPKWVRSIRLLRQIWIFGSMSRLFLYLLREKPQIVHAFLPAAYLVGGTFAVLARTPIRLMSRRGRPFYFLRRPWSRRYELQLHRFMSGFLGNSRRVVQDLREEGIDEEKLHLIYNGVELERFAEAIPLREKAAGSDFTIVCLANLIPYKGHEDILHALALIKNQLPERWRLLLVGRDDGHAQALKRLSSKLSLNDHVEFLGGRSDVPQVLAQANLGVLASHEEGFSNAVIECMAAGLPMVVTDVGGNAEAVTPEIGKVVPPHAPEELSRAILAIADSDRLETMGKLAAARAQTLYSVEECVKEYCNLYDLYLSKRK